MSFVDLGTAPPSNAYLTTACLSAPERWFPLRVRVCTKCWLVQTEDFTDAKDLFRPEYEYFSGFSDSWLAHALNYTEDMIRRFDLTKQSQVVEIAANDGYLLQYVKARGIPCVGVEPTASTAAAARDKGIPIIEDFFGTRLAEEMLNRGYAADLVAANNVLAHVPDINDFVSGFARLLKPKGVATFEFPHLQRLIENVQFDTIYHEHYSYLSLTTVQRIFASCGLHVFDAEELTTHGGSLRVFAQRADSGRHDPTTRLGDLLTLEASSGVCSIDYYSGFQSKTEKVKDDLLAFLLRAKRQGARVVGYGAAAKGNTLMNFAGVRSDMVSYVSDRNPAKQGKFTPGGRIPIVGEALLRKDRPAYVVLFPWNLRNELVQQLAYVREWDGKFVTAVPRVQVS